MSSFEELKRRNVIRVAILYLVSSWVLLQLTDVLSPLLNVPESVGSIVVLLLILGFIPVVIFAWAYEMTPEGVKRQEDIDRSQSITAQTGKRINTLIIALLVVAIAVVAVDRMLPEAVPVAVPVASSEAESPTVPAKSIAVLPFADLSPEGDQEYFSEGIAEEILNVLVRIEGLKVASRTTSWGFKGQEALGIPNIAGKMNVRHVLEGSVRKSGDSVRITAQLIDAATDQHL